MSVLNAMRITLATRRLWWFNAKTRSMARFKRTILGNYWLGVSNILSSSILAVVYGTVFGVNNFKHYSAYILLGLTSWNVLTSAISSAPAMLEQRKDCINNTNIPILVYLLEEWAFNLRAFIQSMSLSFIVLIILDWRILLNIPHAIAPIVLFVLLLFWLPSLVCLAGARYQDLYQIVPLIIVMTFLISPILYFESRLGNLQLLANLNPLYSAIALIRDALLDRSVNLNKLVLLSALNIIGLYITVGTYSRMCERIKFMI